MATPTITPGFAMNYSNRGEMTDPAVLALLDADLADMWEAGIRKIRTGVQGFDYSRNLDIQRPFVLYVKNKGFKVLHGVGYKVTTDVVFGSTRWNNYKAAVLAEAQWAQDNGIDEFCTGNEEGLHVDYSDIINDNTTYPTTNDKNIARGARRKQIRDDQRALATQCQAIFTRGPICVSASRGEITNDPAFSGGWIQDTEGLGDYDRLDCNLYDRTSLFRRDVKQVIDAFGIDRIGVTEFCSQDGFLGVTEEGSYNVIGGEEEKWALDLVQRATALRDFNVNPFYYFSFNQFERNYALRANSTNDYRQAWMDMVARMNGKKPRYTI